MGMLFKVVERMLSPDGRNLVSVGGLWHEDIEVCRRTVARIAETSLAHWHFIVNSTGLGKGREAVLEENDLPSLAQRLAVLHAVCLTIRNPARLAEERRAMGRLPEWRQRPPLLRER